MAFSSSRALVTILFSSLDLQWRCKRESKAREKGSVQLVTVERTVHATLASGGGLGSTLGGRDRLGDATAAVAWEPTKEELITTSTAATVEADGGFTEEIVHAWAGSFSFIGFAERPAARSLRPPSASAVA